MSTPTKPFVIPKVEKSQILFEESIIKIRCDILKLLNNPPYHYFTLETKKYAVVVLATTAEGWFVLNEEYRHPTGKILLGCPGGYIDDKEDPIDAAARELREETGYEAKHFEVIGSAYPCAGITGQKTFFIRATQAILVAPPHLEASEIIRTVLKSEKELEDAIRQGVELDGTLGTAFFFAKLFPT